MLEVRRWCYDFRGHQGFPVAASGVGSPFVTAVTGAGPPAISAIEGGGLRLGLEATNEVQNLCLSFGDALSFDIDQLVRISAIVKGSDNYDASVSAAFGLASGRNDTIDSIAEAALFRCVSGANTVVAETDDGTNDNDDVATGVTLGNNWTRFAIDFASRNTTIEPPSVSTGRPSNIEFYAGLAQANSVQRSLRRVASNTRFDMSNYGGGLQPFFQIQKTASAAADFLDVLCVEVEYNIEA